MGGDGGVARGVINVGSLLSSYLLMVKAFDMTDRGHRMAPESEMFSSVQLAVFRLATLCPSSSHSNSVVTVLVNLFSHCVQNFVFVLPRCIIFFERLLYIGYMPLVNSANITIFIQKVVIYSRSSHIHIHIIYN